MVQGWGQGDLALVDEIVAPDVIDHDPFPGQKAGREGWKQAILMIRAIMPDMRVSIQEMVQEGEHVAVRYMCVGTNLGEFQGRPPTGKPMLIRGIGIERITNGKMSETHRSWTFASTINCPPIPWPSSGISRTSKHKSVHIDRSVHRE